MEAKKKIQEELHKGKKKSEKQVEGKRRDYRLTLGRALTDGDELETSEKSCGRLKRAREKRFKKGDDQEEIQKIAQGCEYSLCYYLSGTCKSNG